MEVFCVEACTEGCSENSAPLLAEARNQCHSYCRREARFHQDKKKKKITVLFIKQLYLLTMLIIRLLMFQLYIKHTVTYFLS